jgi:hypothetical protein
MEGKNANARDGVFICHASEDKENIARPLADILRRRGIQVWFDEFSLTPGASLRREIGRGLRDCASGIVILSPTFFKKEWAQRELDALTSFEIEFGEKRIIPVWHGLTRRDILQHSPELADRLAISSDKGIGWVADQIQSVLRAQGLGLMDDDAPLRPVCASKVPWPCRVCSGTGKCQTCDDKGWAPVFIAAAGVGRRHFFRNRLIRAGIATGKGSKSASAKETAVLHAKGPARILRAVLFVDPGLRLS